MNGILEEADQLAILQTSRRVELGSMVQKRPLGSQGNLNVNALSFQL